MPSGVSRRHICIGLLSIHDPQTHPQYDKRIDGIDFAVTVNVAAEQLGLGQLDYAHGAAQYEKRIDGGHAAVKIDIDD